MIIALIIMLTMPPKLPVAIDTALSTILIMERARVSVQAQPKYLRHLAATGLYYGTITLPAMAIFYSSAVPTMGLHGRLQST